MNKSFLYTDEVGYAEYLIDNGKVDINTVTEEGLSKLVIAVINNQVEMAKMLIKKGINRDKDVFFGSPKTWELFKDSINEQDKSGNTVFHLTDDITRIHFLLHLGARCNIKNNEGKTAYDIHFDKGVFNMPVSTVKTYILNLSFEEQKDLINTMVSSWKDSNETV